MVHVFCSSISQDKLTALLKHYKEFGLTPRHKQSGGRRAADVRPLKPQSHGAYDQGFRSFPIRCPTLWLAYQCRQETSNWCETGFKWSNNNSLVLWPQPYFPDDDTSGKREVRVSAGCVHGSRDDPSNGIYANLMRELGRESQGDFTNYMRMEPGMFHELLLRLTPRLTKMDTHYRRALEPGLKLAITLRYMATTLTTNHRMTYHQPKDRSQYATASGDRSKHCRSVARSLNRNQSYDQEIVRSGVTVGMHTYQESWHFSSISLKTMSWMFLGRIPGFKRFDIKLLP